MRVDTKPVMTQFTEVLEETGKLITQIIIQNIWIKRREVYKRQNKNSHITKNPKKTSWFPGGLKHIPRC